MQPFLRFTIHVPIAIGRRCTPCAPPKGTTFAAIPEKGMESTIKLTHDRVRENTSKKALERIDRQTEENIHRYASQGRAAIRERIESLNKEWDTERTLEITSGINVLLGLTLGLTVNRRWLLLSAVSASFLVKPQIE